MRKLFIILTVVVAFYSCEKDAGIGQFDDIVVENPYNTNKFRQITFIVDLKHADFGYLNLTTIDSMEIFVNAKYWGTFSSEIVDTTEKTDRVVENIPYSDKRISYLFIAPYQLKTDNLETAGDFVDYLNDRISLTPGDYVCEIKKIKFKNLNGGFITRKIQAFADFRVIENTTSSYVGEIEIILNR